MYELLCSAGPTYLCRAVAPETASGWASGIVAAVALWLALKSWRSSVTAIRSSYRPLLRPIAVKSGFNRTWFLIVKNYGTGPALAVRLLDHAEVLQASIDVIEPLGPRENGDETKRVGRRVIHPSKYFEHAHDYRLLYQDLGGRWHETSFRYSVPERPPDAPFGSDVEPRCENVRYLGPRRNGFWFPQIPRGVSTYLAHVTSEEE